MAVITIIFPALSKFYAKGAKHRFNTLVIKATYASSLFALPVVLLFVLGPAWVLKQTFGEAFVPAKNALFLLSLAFVTQVLEGPIWQTLIITGNEKIAILITIISVIAFTITSVFIIPLWGIEGAAVAISAFYAPRGVLALLAFSRLWSSEGNQP